MSNLIRWRDDHHMLPLVLAASVVLVAAIGAAVMWAQDNAVPAQERIAALSAVQAKFEQVKVGQTSQPELVKLGLDAAHYKTRTLSGLGVQEYFMPKTTTEFDAMDPALRSCFENVDRCRAVVFPLARPSNGFMAANAAPREKGRMVFLLRNGRVAYKSIDGI